MSSCFYLYRADLVLRNLSYRVKRWIGKKIYSGLTEVEVHEYSSLRRGLDHTGLYFKTATP